MPGSSTVERATVNRMCAGSNPALAARKIIMPKDLSVSDIKWWFSAYSNFEDFVGIGEARVLKLAEQLKENGINDCFINRLLKANKLPHGPCNTKE